MRVFFIAFIVCGSSLIPSQDVSPLTPLEEPRSKAKRIVHLVDQVSKRVVVEFSGRLADFQNPHLQETYRNQILLDEENTEFVPDQFSSNLQRSPLGNLNLVPVANSRFSSVFTTRGDREIIVKYQTDLGDAEGKVTVLFKDFHFGSVAHHHGISPKYIFLSPPVLCPNSKTLKTNFEMPTEWWAHVSVKEATVRYLIMQRGGETVKSLARKKANRNFSLLEAVNFGIQLLEAIRKLHDSAGIIHGDLHYENVLIRRDSGEIELIDFGRAKYVSTLSSNSRAAASLKKVHHMQSPWEMDGYEYSRRDDVYRVLQMMVQLMNDDSHEEEIRQGIENNPRAVMNFKASGSLISESIIQSATDLPVIQGVVRYHIKELLSVVRGTKRVTDRPNYEEIDIILHSIQSLLSA